MVAGLRVCLIQPFDVSNCTINQDMQTRKRINKRFGRIIISYGIVSNEETKTMGLKLVTVDEENRLVSASQK